MNNLEKEHISDNLMSLDQFRSLEKVLFLVDLVNIADTTSSFFWAVAVTLELVLLCCSSDDLQSRERNRNRCDHLKLKLTELLSQCLVRFLTSCHGFKVWL